MFKALPTAKLEIKDLELLPYINGLVLNIHI